MRSEGKIYHDDWMNNGLPDKSVQLIIADPPYFEVKGDFDFVWDSFEHYLQDVERWAFECKRLLAENGTLFWWGDEKRIAYTQIIIDKYFGLVNNLVWHKWNLRGGAFGTSGGDNLRSFPICTERLLMYDKSVNKTGLQEIYSDDNCFESIKEYLRSEKQKSKLTSKELNYMFSKYTNKEGCLDRSVMEHYWQKSQWVFPTQEIYENILQNTGFWQKPYEELRKEYEELRKEYEELRKEYEELRRPFENKFNLTELLVFNTDTNPNHDTPKPEQLTRALILTCSRKNDLVFVPFAGSGTECAMAAKEGRRFIGFDTELKHVEYANKRCETILSQPQLF